MLKLTDYALKEIYRVTDDIMITPMAKASLHSQVYSIKRYLLFAFAFTMPLNQKISTLILIVLAALSLPNILNRQWLSRLRYLWPLLLLYLIYVIAYARDEAGFGAHWFEQKASFLVCPIVLLGVELSTRKSILKSFAFGCICSYIVCLVVAFARSIDGFGFDFVQSAPGVEVGFLEAIDANANRLLGTSFIVTEIQRAYLAMYFSFSFCVVWTLFDNYGTKAKFFMSLALIFGIVQSWSLAGIVSLMLATTFLIVTLVKSNLLKLTFFGALSLSVVGIVNFNPRAKLMYWTIVNNQLNIEGPTATTVRFRPWTAAINQIPQKPFFGFGMENSQKALNSFYQERVKEEPKYQWPLNESFNAHNQYFQLLLESGILGFFAFVCAILYCILNVKYFAHEFKLLSLGFLFLVLLNCLFESILNRYIGISFFAFFYCIFIPTNLNRAIEPNKKS